MAFVGLAYGTTIGLFGHWLLFFQLKRNRRNRSSALKGIGAVFLVRYLVDLVLLLAFSYVTRNGVAITVAALSITVSVKIALYIVFVQKGGRID